MVSLPLRHAWRSLRRTPIFTIAAAVTLLVGIGAAVAIFAVVHGVLLNPLPYGDPDRLVATWHDLPPLSLSKANQTPGTYFTYQRFARSIEASGLYQEGAVNVAEAGGTGAPQRLASAWVTATLIPTLQVSPILGRSFSEAEDRPNGPLVVLLSEGVWRTRFGADRGVIGRSLEINGRTRQIIGVMPQRFRFPTATTRLWLPLQLDSHAAYSGGFSYDGIARLRRGVSIADAERDFAAVLPRVVELFPNLAPGVSTQMLLDQAKPKPVLVALRQDVTGTVSRTLWIVAAAAGLVLLVACANVANLLLVRADQRQRELALREALGAGRTRLMAHFLSEAGLLAALAGAGGLAVAWLAVRTLVVAGPTEIPRLAEVHIDPATVGFAVAIALLVALVCTVIPALRLGRSQELTIGLHEGGRGGTAGKARHRLRGAMVAFQVALALVVLAGSGLLLRTFQRLNAIRPGFSADHVATFWMSLPQARYANDAAVVRFYSSLTARVEALPDVRAVGLASRLPLMSSGMNQNPFYSEDDPTTGAAIPPLQIYTTTDGGYFKTMGIPLLAGRSFDPLVSQRDLEAIVSQRTAEHFWKDPTGKAALGKRFRELPSGPWRTIVGVVGNVRDTALGAPPTPAVYLPQVPAKDTLYSQVRNAMALVVRTGGESDAVTAAVQRAVRELDPTLPTFDVRPMSAVLRASTARLSFTIIILGAAAAVTLLLGGIGLYGVMAYLVTLRTRELGVRIALGAQPGAVARMITVQGLALTLVGIGTGLAIFALTARFLRSLLFGVSAGDPLTLGAAALALLAVAALASWIPARRAARVDPATTLKAE